MAKIKYYKVKHPELNLTYEQEVKIRKQNDMLKIKQDLQNTIDMYKNNPKYKYAVDSAKSALKELKDKELKDKGDKSE